MAEIDDPAHQRQIFLKLLKQNDPYSYPIRGMLQLILMNKIKRGLVYADRPLPDSTCFACIQETLEYSEIDGDILTIYFNSLPSTSASEEFVKFFDNLRLKRQWKERPLLIMYIKHDLIPLVRHTMNGIDCKDLGSMIIFERFKVPMDPNDKAYEDVVVEKMRLEDVPEILAVYDSPIPAKSEMFHWMVEKLPSVAIRTRNSPLNGQRGQSQGRGQLLCFALTYACGASGVLYVKPGHRNKGYGYLAAAEITDRHMNLFYGTNYAAISPDNPASIKMSLKAKHKRTETLVNWVVFTPRSVKLDAKL